MATLTDRLKELRGTTLQREVAAAIGVQQSTYTLYENGKREPGIDTILKMADYHKVTVDYLLGRTDIKSVNIETIDISKETGLAGEAIERLKAFSELGERLKGGGNNFNVIDTINYLLTRNDVESRDESSEIIYKDFYFFMLIHEYLCTTDRDIRKIKYLDTGRHKPHKIWENDDVEVYFPSSLDDSLLIGEKNMTADRMMTLVLHDIVERLKKYRAERQSVIALAALTKAEDEENAETQE